jgi:hypothetical protein
VRGRAAKDLPQIGNAVGLIRRGTETSCELVVLLDGIQQPPRRGRRVARGRRRPARPAASTAVGRLKVDIDGAGANYRFSPVVRIRTKTASIAAFTALLVLDCPT